MNKKLMHYCNSGETTGGYSKISKPTTIKKILYLLHFIFCVTLMFQHRLLELNVIYYTYK